MTNQENKDLCILIDNTTLNIRTMVLLETPDGYVFEQSKKEYFFALGGRVKLHESTEEAALRELNEEIGVENVTLNMIGIIENFFTLDGEKDYHEINFVYSAKISTKLDFAKYMSKWENLGFKCIKKEDLDSHDIRPKVVVEMLKTDKAFLHLVNRDN